MPGEERECGLAREAVAREHRPPAFVIGSTVACRRCGCPRGGEVDVRVRGVAVPAAAARHARQFPTDARIGLLAWPVAPAAVCAEREPAADLVIEERELRMEPELTFVSCPCSSVLRAGRLLLSTPRSRRHGVALAARLGRGSRLGAPATADADSPRQGATQRCMEGHQQHDRYELPKRSSSPLNASTSRSWRSCSFSIWRVQGAQ